MLPFFSTQFGNASSRRHAFGWAAEDAVESARAEVAGLVGARKSEVIFTSGGTESNNLAILGSVLSHPPGCHMISVATEHDSVLGPCRALSEAGYALTILGVNSLGELDIDELRKCLRPETVLVSTMVANHEIGTISAIDAIAEVCNAANVALHVDAVQAVGKIPFDMQLAGCSMISLSAHKIYGPKGVGALVVSGSDTSLRLRPLMHGGGHEGGLRPGSLAVPLIVGFGAAAKLALEEMPQEAQRLTILSGILYHTILANIDGVRLNGSSKARLPGNLNISFAGVDGDELLHAMAREGLAVSSGAACSSGTMEPSHVLAAIGVGEELAQATIRFGLGRFTTAEEVDSAARIVTKAVRQLRAHK
jgi:cysteine desulfurase